MAAIPLRFSAQLKQQLKSLRKQRALTQLQVANQMGVSQARIAEIEANPGLVSFDQIMQFLTTLGVEIYLHDKETTSDKQAGPAASPEGLQQAGGPTVETIDARGGVEALRKAMKKVSRANAYRNLLVHQRKGSW